MHGRAVVIDPNAVVGIKQKHARQRSNSSLVDINPREQRHLDIKYGCLSRSDRKAMCSGGALAV
jgi:hypothetical protein